MGAMEHSTGRAELLKLGLFNGNCALYISSGGGKPVWRQFPCSSRNGSLKGALCVFILLQGLQAR